VQEKTSLSGPQEGGRGLLLCVPAEVKSAKKRGEEAKRFEGKRGKGLEKKSEKSKIPSAQSQPNQAGERTHPHRKRKRGHLLKERGDLEKKRKGRWNILT